MLKNMADMSCAGHQEESEKLPTGEGWIEYDVEIFIQELQKLECLWNTSLASYKDRNCKINAWEHLGALFNKDGMKFHSILLFLYCPKFSFQCIIMIIHFSNKVVFTS